MAAVYETSTPIATPLRPGPIGLPRGHVTEIQRSRMVAAAIEVVEEVGYGPMTVSQVIGRARVSRKTFYDVFVDREDCFLAAFRQTIDSTHLLLRDAYEAEPTWRDGVRAALARLLLLMDRERGLARLCVVEALAAGGSVLAYRASVLDQLAAVVDLGRNEAHGARQPSELTAEGVVAGVLGVLHTRLLEADGEPLQGLLGSLMSMIVLPYLGARAARRELNRPAAARRPCRLAATESRGGDPLEGLNMRLTYRTVRVLTVIGEHPGASNRSVAERSDIGDQGQMSKLLNRLSRLGLIVNLGEGQERGSANSWHLTARGTEVERAARPR